MALRSEIVHLIRLEIADQPRKPAAIGQVAIMQRQPIVLHQMLDALEILRTTPSHQPVNGISFFQK